jgi:hypothetical protein
MTIKEKLNVAAEELKHALEWCRNDSRNEDGWPTEEMLIARVESLEQTLAKLGIEVPEEE